MRKDFRKADQLFRLAVSIDTPPNSSSSSTVSTSSYWGQRYSSFLQSLQKRNALQWLLANQLPPLEISNDDNNENNGGGGGGEGDNDDNDASRRKQSNTRHQHHRRKSSGDSKKNDERNSDDDDDNDEVPFAPVSMIVARTVRDVLVANRRCRQTTNSEATKATTTTTMNDGATEESQINKSDLQTALKVKKSVFRN